MINGDITLKQKNPLAGSDLVKADYNMSLFGKSITQIYEDNALRNESLLFNGIKSILPICAGTGHIAIFLI